MKTFHVSLLFVDVNGPIVETTVIKATTPQELEFKLNLAIFDVVAVIGCQCSVLVLPA
jgi:hypothetical protein